MKRKRLAVLLAFGLMAALLVVVSGSANAATYTAPANSGSDCAIGALPDGLAGGNLSGILLTTDGDDYETNSTINVEFGLDNMVNGPFPTAGTEVWELTYQVTGAATATGVATESRIETQVIAGSAAYDPGNWTFPITTASTPGTVTIEILSFLTDTGAAPPPDGILNCDLYSDLNTAGATEITPSVTVNVNYPAFAGTFGIDSIDETVAGSGTGQTVTTHARPGVNTVTFSGDGFDPGATATVAVCSTVAPDAFDASCATSTTTATISGTGVLAASTLDVAAGEVPGSKDLVISDGINTARASLTILGTRTLSANPPSGGAGTTVSLTGSNWDPGAAVTFVGLDGIPPVGPPTDGPVFGAADANGNLIATSFTVSNSATVFIAGSEAEDNPPLVFANAATPFAVAAESCSAGSDGTGSCDLLQNIVLEIQPGELTQTRAGTSGSTLLDVDLGSIQLNGSAIPVSGDIYQITVVDARGNSLGWTLQASLTDMNNTTAPAAGDNIIENTSITLTPSCGAIDASSGASVSGGASTMGGTITLCSVASGLGGGSWTVDAGIDFTVPANQNAGDYLAVLTTTLS